MLRPASLGRYIELLRVNMGKKQLSLNQLLSLLNDDNKNVYSISRSKGDVILLINGKEITRGHTMDVKHRLKGIIHEQGIFYEN